MVPHPLPVGGGTLLDNRLHIGGGISIHPPRGGEGQAVLISIRPEWVFQSTLPVWGGTKGEPTRRPKADRFQSTLPARGGTKLNGSTIVKTLISIHPPREGRDTPIYFSFRKMFLFQSTLPARGGTSVLRHIFLFCSISIHPPRVGRDFDVRPVHCALAISIHPPRVERDPRRRPRKENNPYFNPPSPCGEGQQKYTKILFYFMHF